jgi:hypothetical protein
MHGKAKLQDWSLQSGFIFGSVNHSQKNLGKWSLLLKVASPEHHALPDLGEQHSSISELSRFSQYGIHFITMFSIPNDAYHHTKLLPGLSIDQGRYEGLHQTRDTAKDLA